MRCKQEIEVSGLVNNGSDGNYGFESVKLYTIEDQGTSYYIDWKNQKNEHYDGYIELDIKGVLALRNSLNNYIELWDRNLIEKL